MLVNMHRTVGQNLSDVHVEPSYLQPSGGGVCVYFCVVLWQFDCFSLI